MWAGRAGWRAWQHAGSVDQCMVTHAREGVARSRERGRILYADLWVFLSRNLPGRGRSIVQWQSKASLFGDASWGAAQITDSTSFSCACASLTGGPPSAFKTLPL